MQEALELRFGVQLADTSYRHFRPHDMVLKQFRRGGMWCYAEVENLAGPTAWLSRNLSTGSLSGGEAGPRWPTHGLAWSPWSEGW